VGENPNINCLEEWQCPKCKSYGPFWISATVRAFVLMSDDGTLESQTAETDWEEESYARCSECDHPATVEYFTSPRTVLDDIVEATGPPQA
jgi:hypothetical protein